MEDKLASANLSSSQHYDDCLGPMFFEPYAIEVVKRVDPSAVNIALELACGTGRVTRHLRNTLNATAKLIASDIDADMMAIARQKLANANIEWQIIHAEELPFADNSIDLVVCCFGFMFVADKPKAYKEVLRVLTPGGMLIMTTWDKLENNAASYTYRRVAEKYINDQHPETCNTAVSMHNAEAIEQDLQQAGFSKIRVETVGKLSENASAKQAVDSLTQSGTVYDEIMKRNPAKLNKIKETLLQEFTEQFGAAPMKAPISALITQAWK